jgi:ABC-type bacteriocin/lantibiotic exporter with double-glycine peptidase domain
MALTILPPVVADIANALQSANKVMHLIDRQPAINTKGGLTLPRCDGNIEFSNVTLVLPPNESPALVHVSFKVEARTHAAFFGQLTQAQDGK